MAKDPVLGLQLKFQTTLAIPYELSLWACEDRRCPDQLHTSYTENDLTIDGISTDSDQTVQMCSMINLHWLLINGPLTFYIRPMSTLIRLCICSS